MQTGASRSTADKEISARTGVAILVLILLSAGLCAVLHAVAKPFWYDEICTIILCRLPNMSEIWKALDSAADTNPPVYYLVARWARQLAWDDHLGYRLPSMLGLLAVVACVYVILAKRVNRLSALIGATLVLCTPAAAFGYEARPYALMLASISLAILAWQRIDESKLYALIAAAALAAAESLHYYAIFVWPAFVLAEASVLMFRRRFRAGAWAALLVGALPLLLFSPLLLRLQEYYGKNFWARPSVVQIFLAQDWLFNFGGHAGWGWTLAAVTTVVFLFLALAKKALDGAPGGILAALKGLPLEEQILTLILLWLPVIAFVAATVSHGGLAERYMLPTVLGGALALGYVVDIAPAAVRALLLLLLLAYYASTSVEVVKGLFNGSLLEARTSATHEAAALVAQLDAATMPIVIADGSRYLPMVYYSPDDVRQKIYAIADPVAAITFADNKSDSVDLALLVLRRYFPLQVEDYHGFVSRHPEFFLVSEGGGLNWWPARLARGGYSVGLVSAEGQPSVFRVAVER